MSPSQKQIKDRAKELAEGYQDAKDVEFHEQFCNLIVENDNFEHVWTEDCLTGFIESFTFPDEADWAADAVQAELDDIGDAKHEQAKDER